MRSVSSLVSRSLVGLLVVSFAGCAYPRRTASLSTVPPAEAANANAPGSLVRLRFISAEVPPNQRGGLDWDDDGTPPDPFIRIYRGDAKIYESEPVEDALRPSFEVVSENLSLPTNEDIRIELWDDDTGIPEPIGTWHGRGLPRTALPGADSNLTLEGGAQLLFRVVPAEPLRGSGIEEYEVRGNALVILSMVERSPAGRAGVRVGDEVTAIDGKSISELGDDAPGALSMASSRRSSLTVVHSDGSEETVELDGGYTWRAR